MAFQEANGCLLVSSVIGGAVNEEGIGGRVLQKPVDQLRVSLGELALERAPPRKPKLEGKRMLHVA